MEVVTLMTKALVQRAAAEIKLQFGYLLHYRYNIRQLQELVEDLEVLQYMVKYGVENAERNGEAISPEVVEWLKIIDEVHNDAQVLSGNLNANQCCPNLWSRYIVSRRVLEMKFVIEWLLEERSSFVHVSAPAPPLAVERMIGGDDEDFESRRQISDAIIEALEDEQVSTIGVEGAGGVGKTTLMKTMAKVAEERHLFSEILMATVSSTPNEIEIQSDIADQLELESEEDSLLGRADRLRKRLVSSKGVLLIMDDVRNEIDLDAVGIPRGKSCKIILTSRDERVCRKMNCQRIFQIQPLLPDEAKSLFIRAVGDTIDSGADLLPIAEEIVVHCAGLPLAICLMANSLKGRSIPVWLDALYKLQDNNLQKPWHKYTDFAPKSDRVADDLYSPFQVKLSLFKPEERYCFFLCMFFAKEVDISVEDLMRYGMSSMMFENVQGIQEARKKTQEIVEKLKQNAFLVQGKSVNLVRVQDNALRDFAKVIKSGGKHKILLEEGESVDKWTNGFELTDYSGISLLNTRIAELPDDLDCPEVEVFKFQSRNEGQTLKMPKNFFAKMGSLRVLVMNGMSIPSLPSSITDLKKLQTLCLEDCKLEAEEEISIIGQLKDLKILSLRQSEVAKLTTEIEQLKKLRILDLTGCSRLNQIPRNLISKLTSLESLCLRDSFNQWGTADNNNADLEELKQLPHLTNLEIRVSNMSRDPEFLSLPNLTTFHIVIGSGRYEVESDKSLYMEGVHFQDPTLSAGVQKLVKNAQLLVFKSCSEVFDKPMQRLAAAFAFQRNISIKRVDGNDQKVNAVEVLKLIEMENKTEIRYPQLGLAGAFPFLRDLYIEGCNNLEFIFPSNILLKLPLIRSISIQDCKLVTKICDKLPNNTRVLRRLHKLKLQNLPELECFCLGRCINFPLLKKLLVCQCPNMKMFNVSQENQQGSFFDEKVELPALEELTIRHIQSKEIWSKRLEPKSFPRLKVLNVENCDGLSKVVPPNGIQSLENLTTLSIKGCKSLQEVLEVENTNSGVKFPLVSVLSLVNLPHLRSFCSGDSTFEWPSLGEVYLEDCPDMKTFCPRIKETPKLSAISHPVHGSLWEGDLNKTVQHLYKLTTKDNRGLESSNISQSLVGNTNKVGISDTAQRMLEMQSENSGEAKKNKLSELGPFTGEGHEEGSIVSTMRERSIDVGGLGASGEGDGPSEAAISHIANEDFKHMQQGLAFTDQFSRDAIRAVVLEVLYGQVAPEGAMHGRPIIDEVCAQARDVATQHVVKMISNMHQACLDSQGTPPSPARTPGGS